MFHRILKIKIKIIKSKKLNDISCEFLIKNVVFFRTYDMTHTSGRCLNNWLCSSSVRKILTVTGGNAPCFF